MVRADGVFDFKYMVGDGWAKLYFSTLTDSDHVYHNVNFTNNFLGVKQVRDYL